GQTDVTAIEPIAEYVGDRSNSGQVIYRPVDPDTGKPGKAAFTANPGDIRKCESYEEHAIDAVSNFLRDMERYPAGHPSYLPPSDIQGIADRVLTAVHKFHTGELRKGNGWDTVRTRLLGKYLEVLSNELKALVDLGPRDKPAVLARGNDVTAR